MASDTMIGGKITTLRESLKLSIDDLAARCDCSPSVIEGLEAGELAPSLAPLIAITRALGVRLGTLLDDDVNLGAVITRAGDADSVARLKSLKTSSDAGVLQFAALAASKAARHMEPFLIEVTPGEPERVKLSSHEGEEFIYVLSGSVEIAYGKELFVLNAGDSIYLDSIVPHQVRAYQDVPARMLAVVHEPA